MGFRFNSAISAGKHWIDATREHDECKATVPMKFIQDFQSANTRSLDLMRMKRGRFPATTADTMTRKRGIGEGGFT